MTVEATRRRDADVMVERNVAVVATAAEREQSFRWGPVLGGFLAALGLFLLLSLLAVTIGASVVTPDGSPPTILATAVASLIALFSFFAGGFIASWGGAQTDPARGALMGFLVWCLWLLVVLVAGGLGLGALFGAMGSLVDDISRQDLSRQQIVDALAAGSWRSFLALALAAGAASLGGAVGAKDDLHRPRDRS